MIELRHVCAGYPGKQVLEDVSLTFFPGRVLALLGPNGCGKSTLLRTAAGLQPGTGGTIFLDGQPIEQFSSRQIAQKIAYLPQSRTVPNITAMQMVLHGRFPYLPYPRRYRPVDYEIARAALARADALDLADCSTKTLSGGQRQKVYLAMALAQDTQTLLMDEPTAYLDIRHQLKIAAMARELADQGRAVVLVLHDLCLALRTADTLAVFQGGALRQAGTPEEVLQSGTLEQVFQISLLRVETAQGWQYFCT